MANDVYTSPLASRYASPYMLHLFSPDSRFQTWRRLWVALARAQHQLGLPITARQVQELEAHVTDIDYEVAAAREREVRHDVMAHVYAYGKAAPSAAGILHLGATSCYVTDNADLILYRDALRYLRGQLLSVLADLAAFARRYAAVPTLGYTHYQPAQPVTVGKRATLWMQDFLSDVEELDALLSGLKFLGCRGTTGTEASFMDLFDGDEEKIDEMNRRIAAEFGFSECFPVCGQTYPRKVDSRILSCLSSIAQSAYRMAGDIRLLQHDRQLKVISNNLEKKIRSELERMLKDDREGYEKFYRSFGRQLKLSALNNYGAMKEKLQDLLLFYSSTQKKLVTLGEYVSRMPEEQKYIYYASGDSVEAVDHLPQTELLKDRSMEILYFTDKTDEFIPDIFRTYGDKAFRSAVDGDLELGDEKQPETADHQETLDFLKETLGSRVDQVKASSKLKSHPVCLTSGEGMTFEMEKYFAAVQPDLALKAKRILEVNVEHPAFAALESARITDPDRAKKYAEILLNQAMLIAGLPLENPSDYTDLICSLWK